MKIVKCPECGNLQQTTYYPNNYIISGCLIRECKKCKKSTFHEQWEYIKDEFKGNFLDERV